MRENVIHGNPRVLLMKRPHYQAYFPEAALQKYQKLRERYGQRDTDIYISSFTRSGTTWTQMILYQLTTDGNMDFRHIFDVSPWLYYSALRDAEPAYPPEPRILKTHDEYDFFEKNVRGRFIYVCRNGKDVLVSFYHHRLNVKGYTGSFDQHFDEFLENEHYNWFYHVRDWFENKNNLPILFITYESLINDFDNTISKITDFCHITVDQQVLERTRERTRFAFLKKHAAQLGPRPEHFSGAKQGRYQVKDLNEFIRRGVVGEGEHLLSEQQQERYNQKFDQVLGHIEALQHYRR